MKKLLISLLVTGVLVGAVYGAAASMTVTGTDDLGSGSDTVKSPTVGTVVVKDIAWTLKGTDVTQVTTATISFTVATNAETCDVGLNVNTAADAGGDLFAGVATNETLAIGDPSADTVAFAIGDIAAASIGDVDVTLACDDAT